MRRCQTSQEWANEKVLTVFLARCLGVPNLQRRHVRLETQGIAMDRKLVRVPLFLQQEAERAVSRGSEQD